MENNNESSVMGKTEPGAEFLGGYRKEDGRSEDGHGDSRWYSQMAHASKEPGLLMEKVYAYQWGQEGYKEGTLVGITYLMCWRKKISIVLRGKTGKSSLH